MICNKKILKSIKNDAYKSKETLYSMTQILNPYIDSIEKQECVDFVAECVVSDMQRLTLKAVLSLKSEGDVSIIQMDDGKVNVFSPPVSK